MKRICHVTSAHSRYDVRIFEKECTSLANKVYTVFLIVNDDKADEKKNGVHIVSTGFLPKGRKERMIHSMSFIWDKMRMVDADIYHFHDPELMQLFIKAKKQKKTLIFDAHEDTEEQIMDKDWIPLPLRKMFSLMFGIYQKRAISFCDAVVTVTPKLIDKFRKISPNVKLVTNYPIIGSISAINNDKKYDSDKQPYIFFAGGISSQWCHHKIINALKSVQGVRYRLAGPIEENYFDTLTKIDGWEKVDYLGKIPHFLVEKEYQGAIAGMAINECTQIKGEGTLGNTKLFEIMAAQKPVICTNYRLWKEIIDEYHCGICVNHDHVDEISASIKYIKDHPDEANQMGINGRKAVLERYNWATQEEVLCDLYRELIDNRGE